MNNLAVALYDIGDIVQVIPKVEMIHLPIEEQWVGILPEMLDMGGQEFKVQRVEYNPAHNTYVYSLGSSSMWRFWFSDNLLISHKVLNSADDESLDNLIM